MDFSQLLKSAGNASQSPTRATAAREARERVQAAAETDPPGRLSHKTALPSRIMLLASLVAQAREELTAIATGDAIPGQQCILDEMAAFENMEDGCDALIPALRVLAMRLDRAAVANTGHVVFGDL